MKKILATLLIAPLLLVGCNNSESKPEPQGGQKGDPVLTQEQLNALYLSAQAGYKTVKHEKVGTFTVPSASLASKEENDQLISYKKDDGKTLVIVSKLTAKAICTLENLDTFDDVDYAISGIGTSQGLAVCSYCTMKTNTETSETTFHFVLFDAMGNKLWDVTTVDEYPAKPQFRSMGFTDPATKEVSHYTLLYVYGEATNMSESVLYRYDENLVASKAESGDPYAKEALTNNYKFKFSITQGEGEKAVVTEYNGTYRQYTSGMAHTVFDVSHQGTEGIVSNRYYAPSAGDQLALFDHHALYQYTVPLEEHATEYDYYDSGSGYGYAVKTYLLDLQTGETNEVDFPYVIQSVDNSLNPVTKNSEVLTFSPYTILSLRHFENKILETETVKYVVDSKLVLHDDLTSKVTLRKVGNGFFDEGSYALYDGNGKKIGSVASGLSPAVYGNTIRIRKNNKNGLIDEQGKYLVKPSFVEMTTIDDHIAYLYNGSDDFVYYDYVAREDVTPTFSKEGKYAKDIQHGYHIIKGGETDTSNRLFYLGKQIDSLEKASSVSLGYMTTINGLGKLGGQGIFEKVTYTNTDGDAVYHIYWRVTNYTLNMTY